jgi:hypothetical protein
MNGGNEVLRASRWVNMKIARGTSSSQSCEPRVLALFYYEKIFFFL